MKLLKDFGAWQQRVAIAGLFGLGTAVIAAFAQWFALAILGLSVALASVIVLAILGSRQNWRQLKKIQRLVESSTLGLDGFAIQSEIAKQTSSSRVNATDAGTLPGSKVLPMPRPGSSFEMMRRMPHNRPTLETFALRTKSLKMRDAFALSSTRGFYQYADLQRLLAVVDLGMIPASNQTRFKDWEPTTFLTLARLAANQRATDSDAEDAARMFAFAEKHFGTDSLGRNDRLLYVELLGDLAEFKKQRETLKRYGIERKFPVQHALLRLNAVLSVEGSISDRWIQELNTFWKKHNFSEVRFEHSTADAPIDSLRSLSTVRKQGPLVSIIVPTFRGGILLISALRSLLEQTWENLEIIVVDDCSGQDNEEYLLEAAKLSPKIRVIRQPQNLGAYCARNAGLAVAQGEFVTVHDDDDWSHSDKIALQVENLISDQTIPGNMTLHARSTEKLSFLRINNNPQFAQPNFSSLMVRRSLFDVLGPWDTVNRGADAEFRDRIVSYYGKTIEALGVAPLSFTRTREGSLTSGEMSRGYVDPSRLLYLASYQQWHRKADGDSNALASGSARKYPVPSTMEAGRRATDMGTFDVVYATDFRFPGGTTSLTMSEMVATAASGQRVGFIQLESPLNKPSTLISEKLFELQSSGAIEQVSLNDLAHVKLLVIRHPTVVMYLDEATSNLTVDNAVLIVNNPPVLRGGLGTVFDLPECLANVDRLFNIVTTLVAESGVTRKLCRGLVGRSRIADRTWPGVIGEGQQVVPDFNRKPTLGRHSRDHALKWPTKLSDFNAAYTSVLFETSFMGGSAELQRKLGSDSISGKTVHEFGAMTAADYLKTLDFWVYFHDNTLTESFGMSTAEALAAGKVVILPAYMKATFGEAALYAKPDEVAGIVDSYWSDPARYLEQSRLATNYVSEHFSTEALMSRIAEFTGDDKEERPL